MRDSGKIPYREDNDYITMMYRSLTRREVPIQFPYAAFAKPYLAGSYAEMQYYFPQRQINLTLDGKPILSRLRG